MKPDQFKAIRAGLRFCRESPGAVVVWFVILALIITAISNIGDPQPLNEHEQDQLDQWNDLGRP